MQALNKCGKDFGLLEVTNEMVMIREKRPSLKRQDKLFCELKKMSLHQIEPIAGCE